MKVLITWTTDRGFAPIPGTLAVPIYVAWSLSNDQA